jgi:Rrf2 family protein
MSFSLSRKADYALVALAALAEGRAGERGEARALSARAIAERYDLPVALLMNILKDLHRGGILESRRGPTGGYRLASPAGQVTMLSVIEAVDGPVKVALCCDDESGQDTEGECIACRVLAKCPVNPPMQQFNDMVRGFLGSITLADLLTEQTQVTLNSLKLNPVGVEP